MQENKAPTSTSLQVTDSESELNKKTTNRVSLESMEKRIDSVEYIYPASTPHMTFCFIRFDNGFTITGESCPADPENFNEELGRKFAYETAMRKAWPLFGFLMCEKLTN